MDKPRSLIELVAYLEKYPNVVVSAPTFGIDNQHRRYDHHDTTGLWFVRSDDNKPAFLPIACRLTPDEAGVTFADDGFTVTKFGSSIAYRYVEEGAR